jgi:hypothetical protein
MDFKLKFNMKHIFTLLFVISISATSFSQTGLTFGQCLTFSSDGPWTPDSPNASDKTSPPLTVPEGKIWKIEYAYVFAFTSSNPIYLKINGFRASVLNSNYAPFPIWLKSGDYFNFYANNPSTYFVSILEFNAN